jgi:hypothetical protein
MAAEYRHRVIRDLLGPVRPEIHGCGLNAASDAALRRALNGVAILGVLLQ